MDILDMISISIDNGIEIESKMDNIKEIINSEIENVEKFFDLEQIILRLRLKDKEYLEISDLLLIYSKKLLKLNKTNEALIVNFIFINSR